MAERQTAETACPFRNRFPNLLIATVKKGIRFNPSGHADDPALDRSPDLVRVFVHALHQGRHRALDQREPRGKPGRNPRRPVLSDGQCDGGHDRAQIEKANRLVAQRAVLCALFDRGAPHVSRGGLLWSAPSRV